jgi:hypothetical protein
VAIAVAIVAAVAVPIWLLGGDGGLAPVGTTTTTERDAAPSTIPNETTLTTVPDETTTVPGAVAWEGEPFDVWVPVPEEGPVIGVVGVSFDDVLNLRSGPGTQFDVVAELDPTTGGLAGTGAGWQLPGGDVWWEIERDGVVVGWANQRHLARLGDTTDQTASVVDYLGGIPEAGSLEELAGIVAGARGGGAVVVVAPTEGDLGEITVDLVGFADDSVKGERLHVFAARTGDAWVLKSVEQIVFCQRGVYDGICV